MTSQTQAPAASSSAGGGCYCPQQLVLLLLLDFMASAGLLADMESPEPLDVGAW